VLGSPKCESHSKRGEGNRETHGLIQYIFNIWYYWYLLIIYNLYIYIYTYVCVLPIYF
jgi:hypothetical protein